VNKDLKLIMHGESCCIPPLPLVELIQNVRTAAVNPPPPRPVSHSKLIPIQDYPVCWYLPCDAENLD